MPKIRSLTDLIDEHHEIAAWLVLCVAGVGVWRGWLDQWPAVALVGLALVTLLGARRYRGLHAGPSGVGIKDDEGDR